MSTHLMFLLLLSTGLAITGFTGYVIFGPLTYRQMRDRGLRIGGHAFAPDFLRWILGGGFRATRDSAITGLATPAQILSWCCLVGLLLSGLAMLPFLL
ncbi:MAG: hypothetical protein WCZ65_07460 [Lysobacteraceae bacterium]